MKPNSNNGSSLCQLESHEPELKEKRLSLVAVVFVTVTITKGPFTSLSLTGGMANKPVAYFSKLLPPKYRRAVEKMQCNAFHLVVAVV